MRAGPLRADYSSWSEGLARPGKTGVRGLPDQCGGMGLESTGNYSTAVNKYEITGQGPIGVRES